MNDQKVLRSIRRILAGLRWLHVTSFRDPRTSCVVFQDALPILLKMRTASSQNPRMPAYLNKTGRIHGKRFHSRGWREICGGLYSSSSARPTWGAIWSHQRITCMKWSMVSRVRTLFLPSANNLAAWSICYALIDQSWSANNIHKPDNVRREYPELNHGLELTF